MIQKNNRGFGRSRASSTRSGYSRFPNKNRPGYRQKKKGPQTMSERDLVFSIENAKKAPIKETVKEAAYIAKHTFDEFDIHAIVKCNIKNKLYKTPSPIQDQSIPHIIQGRDLIGIANTGTGKTAAFLIPLINKAFKDRKQKVLIVSPTRELAEQINNEFKSLANGLGLYSTVIIGGKNMRYQIMSLRKHSDFVIGTPGRLKDMINREYLDLSRYNNVVLDETDRMVDIGFIKEIKFLIELLPKERQSLFFSATMSTKVQEILQAFVTEPVTVSVKKQDTSANVLQDLVRVKPDQRKVDQLCNLLKQQEFEKVIVFGNTKWGVQKLEDELTGRGLRAAAIHGDKRQSQRQNILERFKRSEITILLATDVASRGLDINNVSHVINYELPQTWDDYVHRIGRTGRANKTGIALTFVSTH